MLRIPWRQVRRKKFDARILRKNNISLLILDERWNKIFNSAPKTNEIERCEQSLRELLMEEARLSAEKNEIAALKKRHLDRILQLTPEVFENGNEAAKKEMQISESEVKRINSRTGQIEEELDRMPDRIRQANLDLLELMVNVVYLKIRANTKRVEELEKLIEESRNRLKAYIEEKESLSQDDTDIYSYFHDLLGGEELEKLDREFFYAVKPKKRRVIG